MSAGGRKVPYRNPPESDLLALHWLVFPLSLPFGRQPRRLSVDGRFKCRNKASFSSFSGVVWTDAGLLDTSVLYS